MPIYEFKCNQCDEFFEVLLIRSDDDKTVKCPKCASSSFERVLSSTNYAMDTGGGNTTGSSQTTRTCSSGSCTTYEIPGHTR
ncbi:MAG: zinc ribbon domain-containing protein [Deltaproteobacteria bacterium]|nr:MAG: zinc ribbon domain-containing protein [Deltaproteobacteria bacterium]RTZ99459.1 MAG: zinc ribbon domain-containing protein [Deltaproteobacteria bacterium]